MRISKKFLSIQEVFDEEWYVDSFPDVAMSGIEPLRHYIHYGLRMGRSPGPDRSPKDFLCASDYSGSEETGKFSGLGAVEDKIPLHRTSFPPRIPSTISHSAAKPESHFYYEDLQGNLVGLNPNPCFEKFGHNIETQPHAPVTVIPYDLPALPVLGFEPIVGIHLHLHYPELLSEFISFLNNIPFSFSLFVSVNESKLVASTERRLVAALKNATVKVKCFENKGRDIASFICGFGKELSRFEYVAHIHSKRSPHNLAKSDWRHQLLVNLMGSSSIVNGIVRLFQTSRNVGMIFPIYHHSLRKQISWGTNFDACLELAGKVGVEISSEKMNLFPAGSMFWARSKAIRPLLEAPLSFSNFPDEASQVDGTPAHAVERLFGEIVKSCGYDTLQIRSEKPHNLTSYYPFQWPYHQPSAIAKVVASYRKNKKKNNRIAICTALTGGYENPVVHEVLDPEIDYLFFTDRETDDLGFWQVRLIDYWHPEKVRMARRVKSNLHTYLTGYDVAVWIDANVVIRGDIKRYASLILKQNDSPIAGISHPLRNCAYLEGTAVVDSGKDISGRVEKQLAHYRAEGYPDGQGMIETNMFVVDLRDSRTANIMANWWAEMVKFSHRDQLSLNYVLWKLDLDWVSIFNERRSLRDVADFAYLGHGRNSGYRRAQSTEVPGKIVDPFRQGDAQRNGVSPDRGPDIRCVDIIVCVHNALDETKACLESVRSSIRPDDRIIIVDDASEKKTAHYLRRFCSQYGAELVRTEPPANGYCVSANTGMRRSTSPYFLLLNSDTILTRDALENMLHVANHFPGTGIIGPLSNAASTQSIPDISNTADQTAVNELPEGLTISDMNQLCQSWAEGFPVPCVPLVHGFCQLIKREVFENIGGFDEESFPQGYGEENDFCIRASNAGYDLRVATSSFVFHAKSASYSDDARRKKLMADGGKMLRSKHGEDRIRQSVQAMEGHYILKRIRSLALDHFERISR